MKYAILAVSLVATNAMALDFDSEWSKFETDFSRLKNYKAVAMVETKKPAVKKIDDEVMDDVPMYNPKSIDLPAKPSADNVLERVDPKSPDRLGYKLEDDVMRNKVTNLYKKPDTVVYSINLTE